MYNKRWREGNEGFQFGLSLTATQNRETLMLGKMGRKGTTPGREQIRFPLGNTTVAERKTEKNGEEGRKAGLSASSKYW